MVVHPPYQLVHGMIAAMSTEKNDGKTFEGLCFKKSSNRELMYVQFWGNGQTRKQFEKIVNSGETLSCAIF